MAEKQSVTAVISHYHFVAGSRTCPLAIPAHHGLSKWRGFRRRRRTNSGSVILCTLILEGTRCASVCMQMEETIRKALVSVFICLMQCNTVYANGRNKVKGTHVCVYIYLMRGDNDDNLKWPFKGTIKVSLLNQLENGYHHPMEVWSAEDDVPEDISGRVTRGEKVRGRGCFRFVSHHDLDYCSSKNCQYLKDDTIFFRVDCVVPELDWFSMYVMLGTLTVDHYVQLQTGHHSPCFYRYMCSPHFLIGSF